MRLVDSSPACVELRLQGGIVDLGVVPAVDRDRVQDDDGADGLVELCPEPLGGGGRGVRRRVEGEDAGCRL